MSEEIEKYNLPFLGELKIFETAEGVERDIRGRYFAHNIHTGYLGAESKTKEELYKNIAEGLAEYLTNENEFVKEFRSLVGKVKEDFEKKALNYKNLQNKMEVGK